MIKSFKCEQTKRLYHYERPKRLPPHLHKAALRKLEILDYAVNLNDLRIPPANRLEALKGNRKGQHSIRINQQWRICFQWQNGHAYQVEIVDYH